MSADPIQDTAHALCNLTMDSSEHRDRSCTYCIMFANELRRQREEGAREERERWQDKLCNCACHSWVKGTKPDRCDCCLTARSRGTEEKPNP